MPKSFNPRSVLLLRKRGYLAENTEHWNAHAKVSQDLMGFVDVIAVRKEELVLCQTTSWTAMSSRLKKIRQNEYAKWLIGVPGIRIVIHGWKKTRTEGGAVRWKVKEQEVTTTDFWGVHND